MSEDFKLKRRHPYDTTVYFLDHIVRTAETLNVNLKGMPAEDRQACDYVIDKVLADLEWSIQGLRHHHRYARTTHDKEK